VPSVNIYQTHLLPYANSNSPALKTTFKLIPGVLCFADPVVVCSKVLVSTCRNCTSQTKWTTHVGRRHIIILAKIMWFNKFINWLEPCLLETTLVPAKVALEEEFNPTWSLYYSHLFNQNHNYYSHVYYMKLPTANDSRQANINSSKLTAFSLSTCVSLSNLPKSAMNASDDANCFGSRKLRRLYNSSTLFCNGVPVSSTRCSYSIAHYTPTS